MGKNSASDWERQYRFMIEHAPLCIHEIDRSGRLTNMNPAGVEVMGLSDKCEVVGVLFLDVVPDGDKVKVRRLLDQAFEGRVVAGDFEALTKNGPRLFSVTFTPKWAASGDVTSLVCFAQDITDSRRASRQLQTAHDQLERRIDERTAELQTVNEGLIRSEEHLRVVTDALPVCVAYADAEQRYRFNNRAYEEWFGRSRAEISGRRIKDVIGDDAYSRIRAYVEKALSGQAVSYETTLMLAGKQRYVSAEYVPHIDEHGRPLGYVALVSDITSRKAAEERLTESEARLLFALEALDGGVWDWNIETGDVYFTDSWFRMLGYEPGEVESHVRTWEGALHPDDQPAVMASLNAHFEGRAPYHSEHRMRAKNGNWIWVIDRGRVVRRDENGKPIRMTGTDVNVTDRRQADDEKRRLETQLQQTQKLESLGVLSGGIAHDFNNLLVSVMGNAELALMTLPGEASSRTYIEDVLSAGKRAARLTQQLLAYSGKGRFVVQPVDLSRLVGEMGQLLKVGVSKNVVIEYGLAENLSPVEADETQLQQVVMNLVTNASEAIGDSSGLIAIRTGAIDATTEYLTNTYLDDSLAAGRYCYAEVADTGCGMEKATVEQIFDPFYTTKFTGRGLGLAAVLGIVRGHKGAIKIDSKPSQGTTFRILFPCSEIELELPTTSSDDYGDWQGRGSILVVDDEEGVRSVAKGLLEHYGYSVMTANDGPDALEVFKQHRDEIAAVLLDLTMPGIDGVQTFRELRGACSDIKVVITSGYSEQEVESKFADERPAGFVEKPFQATKLLKAIRQALENS